MSVKSKLKKAPAWALALWLALNAAKPGKISEIELVPKPKPLIEYLSTLPEFNLMYNYVLQKGLPLFIAEKLPNLFMRESMLKQYAVSEKGAKGYGQLTSIALEELKRQGHIIDPFNPKQNREGTVFYLKHIDNFFSKHSMLYPKLHPEEKLKWVFAGFKDGPDRILKKGIPKGTQDFLNIIIYANPLEFYNAIKGKREGEFLKRFRNIRLKKFIKPEKFSLSKKIIRPKHETKFIPKFFNQKKKNIYRLRR